MGKVRLIFRTPARRRQGMEQMLKRMTKMSDTKNTRREFFRKAAQLTFLSAMVGGSVCLLANERIELVGCSDNQFCKSCQNINTCSLDQAQQFRKNER